MKTSHFLTFVSGVAIATAADCAAPGGYDMQGRYSCNPAHQYPNGQTCMVIEGCPLLCDATGKPIITTGTGTTAQPTQTPTCASPGGYDKQGRYSCSPAHQYPNGQTCMVIEGCPLLCDATGKPIIRTSTTTAQPTYTTVPYACVAPGAYDNKGRYSCNPAHQYPNGQQCKTVEGCPLLCDFNGQAIINKNGTQPMPPPIITNGGSSLGSGVALLAVVFAALF